MNGTMMMTEQGGRGTYRHVQHRQQFQRGRNQLARCRCCGRLTHSTLDGMHDIRLCRVCLESAGQDNAHSDGAAGHVPGGAMAASCPACAGVACMHEIQEAGK